MTKEELHILQHSLGVDQYGQGNQYRNNFYTDPKSPDGIICEKLVDMGMMFRGDRSWDKDGDMKYYMVTKDGMWEVQEQSPDPPKLTRSQLRYKKYLDCDTDLRFGEWLKLSIF